MFPVKIAGRTAIGAAWRGPRSSPPRPAWAFGPTVGRQDLCGFPLYFTTLLPHIQPCLVINIHFMSWQLPSSPTFYRSSYISAFALHRRNGIGPRRRAPRWYPSSTRLNNQQRLQKKGPAAFPADGIAAAILLRWRPPLPFKEGRIRFASLNTDDRSHRYPPQKGPLGRGVRR